MKVVQEGSLKNPSFHGIIIKDPHCNWGFANRIRHNHEDDLDFKWGFLQDYMNQNNIQKKNIKYLYYQKADYTCKKVTFVFHHSFKFLNNKNTVHFHSSS